MTRPVPRIASLAVDPPYRLHVTWQDGSRSRHDLADVVRAQSWAAALRDPVLFRQGQVADDGWQIVWPGTEAALSASGLWQDHHPALPAAPYMSAADFAAWLRELGWSFAQAAAALDVSVRMLKYYAAGTHEIPKTVWLACMQLAAQHARSAAGTAAPRQAPARRPAAAAPLRRAPASAISGAAGSRPTRSR